jgi:hypothetical protein
MFIWSFNMFIWLTPLCFVWLCSTICYTAVEIACLGSPDLLRSKHVLSNASIFHTYTGVMHFYFLDMASFYFLQNIRPSADNLPDELSEIITSCWKEDPNGRPNFTQIVQMLLRYLSTLSPQQSVVPHRTFSSENTILPPESPGTSSLMASRGDLDDTPKGKMGDKPRRGFFFCFSECY